MFKQSDIVDIFNLTPMQSGMLFYHMMEEKSSAYFEQAVFSASGDIDIMVFEEAFNKVIEKYEVLRTVFLYRKVPKPRQVILRSRKIQVESMDFSNLPEEKKAAAFEALKQKDIDNGFDLEKGPLMRVIVVKTGDRYYKIIWSSHHIIMDGWCISIIYGDFIRFYYLLKKGDSINPGFTPPYSDYLKWLERQDKNKGLQVWKEYLEGYETRASVPRLNRPSGQEKGRYNLKERSFAIEESGGLALNRIAIENNATLNVVCQVIWGLLLQRYNNIGDTVFGAVVSGRPPEIEDIENMVGLFINTIPVRVKRSDAPGQTFSDLVEEHQENSIQLRAHEYLPLAEIQSLTPLTRELLDHIIVFENYPVQQRVNETNRANEAGTFAFKVDRVEMREQSIYDFNIVVAPGEKIAITLSYNSFVYEPGFIERVESHLLFVAAQVIANPRVEISNIEITTEAEKQHILLELNDTAKEYPIGKTVWKLFEEQVSRTPGKIAVCSPVKPGDIFSFTGCFKKSSFIFQGELQSINKQGNSGIETNLKILKTIYHNCSIVNNNMVLLIDCFKGDANNESIYLYLKGLKEIKYVIYPIETLDILEITHELNRKADVFSDFDYDGFIILLRLLYHLHLIEPAGVNTQIKVIREVKPAIFSPLDWVDGDMSLKDLLLRDRELSKADVLLLGDTPGIPSTGLLYIASFLKRNGANAICKFYDNSSDYASMKRNIEDLLASVRPSIVAVSLKWFLYIARVLDMCKIVKEYSRRTGFNVRVVVGGNTASYFWEDIIKYDTVDYVIVGDGELPLLQIFRGENDNNISNCAYKKGREIILNPATFIKDEQNSPDIYLSHLDEIMYPRGASVLGSFFIYTHLGCAMNCLYCGGCNRAQQKEFNRKKVFIRPVREVRNDIQVVLPYTSTLQFDFDILHEDLVGYCREIWEGLDLSGHYCLLNNLKPASASMIELAAKTFKYVYWDLDVLTLSESHRKKLFSAGIVKPQPTNEEILAFLEQCDAYENVEVRINLINGLPYWELTDIDIAEKFLSRIAADHRSFSELHWARLHAQPGAPIVEEAGKYGMHSFAVKFEDFLEYSSKNFGGNSLHLNLENLNYPYIYFNDDTLNSKLTFFYSETNKKVRECMEERQLNRSPGKTLTYEQLNRKVGILAHSLRERGVSRGSIVGVMLIPSLEILSSLLAVLKCGAAYMPIDLEFPEDRVKYMIADSGATMCIDGSYLEALAHTDISPQPLEEPGIFSHQDAAYIIFTSGTTGKPKGVMLKHENLVNYVSWFKAFSNLTSEDKSILTSSFAFDLGYTSLYPAILSGLELHILPKEIYLIIDRFLDYIHQWGISYIKITPSFFSSIIKSSNFTKKKLKRLKLMVLGGESINVKDIETAHSICPELRIVNHYGPTEAAVGSVATFIDFNTFDEYKKQPVIGKPIDNAGVYIMDRDSNLLPVGIPGELCISGDGVGIGYLNRSELSAEKFIYKSFLKSRNLFSKRFLAVGVALYKTGDLARWLPNGTIEFLGRIDSQVKVKGYRIELGEIENRLRKHPLVEEALVVIKDAFGENETETNEKGEKYICAYIVSKESEAAFNAHTTPKGKTGFHKKIVTFKEMGIQIDFSEIAEKHRSQIAVKSDAKSLTFGALDRYADRLAYRLKETYDDRYKLSEKERTRYKRQMLLAGWGLASQEKLKSTTVFVAGAGGGASPTLTQLALLGIGTIKICDFDEVELSNLNRQFLHNETRLGMNKAISAQITISKTNPHVKVIPYTQKLTRENVSELVGDSAIIFDMFDGPADKFILSEYAVMKQIPHIIISMTDINAYASVLHSPHTPCYHCIFDKMKLEAIVSGMKGHVKNYSKNPLAVVSPSLFISTGVGVNEAIKILLGFETPAYNKFFYFNQRGATGDLVFTPGYKSMTHLFSEHFIRLCREQGFDWEIGWRGKFLEEFNIEPDLDCPVCGPQGAISRKTLEEKASKDSASVFIQKEMTEDKLQSVALLLHRDILMAVGVIGAMKSGKTCVNLDNYDSIEETCEILEDSEARIIITDDEHMDLAQKLKDRVNTNIVILNIEALEEWEKSCDNCASDVLSKAPDPDWAVFMSIEPDSSVSPMKLENPVKGLVEALFSGSGYTFGSIKEPVSLPDELREYLRKQLPDYMIPSYFVSLNRIPLTPNGKVDKKALPDPKTEVVEMYIPPTNEIEAKLVEIWSKILGVDKIGIDTNFFELGFDSIKALQGVARIHREGFKVEMRDIFSNSSIRQLSNQIKRLDQKVDEGIIKGEVKLTPIQHWFFESNFKEKHHFNMDIMLYRKDGFDPEFLRKAFEKILGHHDALRIVYEFQHNVIRQKIKEPGRNMVDLEIINLDKNASVAEIIRKEAERIQGGINLEAGPLVKLGLFKTAQGDHLLIVIHHLVVDGVSMRILFEDIETLFQQYKNNEKMVLPPKSHSFKLWVEKLYEYADSEIFLEEKNYWAKIGASASALPPFKTDFEEENYLKDNLSHAFQLSEDETKQLLSEVNTSFSTEINDILLTALGLAFKKTFDLEKVLIAMEGHGREQILKDIDISRTIGWFTSQYPVLLDMSYENDLARQIIEVKEPIHRLPNKGIGFGILKYLTGSEHKKDISLDINPRIGFNYLGQFDSDVKQMASFEVSGMPTGSARSTNEKTMYDLNISGMVAGKKLTMSVFYSAKQYKQETIHALWNCYKEELCKVISFCLGRFEQEATPSDFTYKDLSVDQLDQLFD